MWVKVTEITPDQRKSGDVRVNGSMSLVNQETGAHAVHGHMAAWLHGIV